MTTNVMAIMLILTNVVFVAWNLWLAMVAFNKKEHVVAKMVKGLKAVQTRTSQISTMWKRSTNSDASSRSTNDSGRLSGLTELNGSLEQSAAESSHRAQVRGVLTRGCVMGGAVCSWQRRLLLD